MAKKRETDRLSVQPATTPTKVGHYTDGKPTTREKLQDIFESNPPIEKLYDFLSQTADNELAWTGAVKIHVRLMAYRRSLRTFKVRKKNNEIDIKFVRANRRAVAALERLRTAKGEYARAKAFHELPLPARQALFMAADRAGGLLWDESEWRLHPDFLVVPDGNIVASLVPKAIDRASRKDPEIKKSSMFTSNNPNRDRAIEEMMRVYRHLHGNKKPPAKQFWRFLKSISACYQELIPEDFGGGIRSNNTYDATFTRILKQSLSD
jgi:hypothetical protein